MMWQDVLIDKTLTLGHIAGGLASAFDVGLGEIVVVNDVGSFPTVGVRAVVCVVQDLPPGDFTQLLSVYAFGAHANKPIQETVVRFSEGVGCRCLVSDESDNPYAMILLQEAASPLLVELSQAPLDNQGAYVLRQLTSGP